MGFSHARAEPPRAEKLRCAIGEPDSFLRFKFGLAFVHLLQTKGHFYGLLGVGAASDRLKDFRNSSRFP